MSDSENTFTPITPVGPQVPCISLIGMAGCGKSTIGRALAAELGWAFADSDHLIEALYGAPLQGVTDELDKETFLDVESAVISMLNLRRTVLATGGSAVYRDAGMQRLLSLGPLVHLVVPLSVIEERIARNPDRGLAIAPGQTIGDLFREREALYARYATLRCDALQPPERCARWIAGHLPDDVLKIIQEDRAAMADVRAGS